MTRISLSMYSLKGLMSKPILVSRAECTYSSKGKLYRHTYILFFIHFFFPSSSLTLFKPTSSLYLPACLTILDVRLSRSSVLMMSLRCSLISTSLEMRSAELPMQEQGKLKVQADNFHCISTFIAEVECN